MKIKILSVGKPGDPHYLALSETYLGRIRHYTPIDYLQVRPARGDLPIGEIRAREAVLLLDKIAPQDWCVALTSTGRMMDSESFSRELARQQVSGRKTLLFCVGGPYGLGESVLERANQQLSLSRMTLAHELALTFLLEQIYRAFTILHGEGYHK
ncbi:MAG TPA: 23S rRNA (pseudouridine(1915)-N(3))-methyltransferase RlmH [bacterium]|nr:23S rRNA (pseudouridine(1915)-N(3))-methyltransferase RlmH [bacterium]HQI48163.1 23S rRNA (pseudouridine(1915)-N(3))-methyltransferase RlmH [bacterium]HQJ65706.1 23S rRNA (pseudouridine(1915)-N(3))-methyltransferase RlmH [bacterium]